MKGPNLSEWAITHRSMVLYLMIVLMVGGALAFFKLGRAEDPDFTFKVMVVRTLWPGATAREVETELTERIEKKLQETPYLDVLKSASRAGESLIFIQLKDFTPKQDVPESWRQLRKKLDDIHHQLPAGVQGPYPNDEFGDVYVNIYALTGAGYDYAELRRVAVRIQRALRALLGEHQLPVVVAQPREVAIVREIEEFLAGARGNLAREVRQHVVAVEVDLVVGSPGRVALEQLLLQCGYAGRVGQRRHPVQV